MTWICHGFSERWKSIGHLVVENDYLEKLTEDSNEGLAAIAYASGRT